VGQQAEPATIDLALVLPADIAIGDQALLEPGRLVQVERCFGSISALIVHPPVGRRFGGYSRTAASPGRALALRSRKISGSAASATSIISLKSLA
jgi:hypothetical protein